MNLYDPLNKDNLNNFNDEIYFESETIVEKPKKIISDNYMDGIDLPSCDDESEYESDELNNTNEKINVDDI